MGERNLSAATSAARRPTSRSSSTAQPFVDNTFELEHDLIINALSTEISSVGAGGGSIVSISHVGRRRRRARQRGRRARAGVLRPRRHAADGHRRRLLMGILDPDDFAGGAMRLDPELARARRSSRSTRRSTSSSGSRFAYRIAAANIAEEVTNVVDPPRGRPARLHAGRLRRGRPDAAAGRARPDARPARRRPAAPRPILGARAAEHRPRLLRQPQRVRHRSSPDTAGRSRRSSRRWSAGLRERAGGDGDGVPCVAASTGACSARAGRRRSCEVPDGPIDAARSTLVERFHEPTSVATATASRTSRSGRQLPGRARRALREGRASTPLEPRAATPAAARTVAEIRYFDDEPLEAAEYERGALPVGARIDGPARDPRGARRRPSSARARPPRSGASASSSSRRADDRRGLVRERRSASSPRTSSRALRLRPLHRDRAGQPLRLRRRAHVRRLLTAAFSPILRDFYDFAATITGPPDQRLRRRRR